jgi:hypothetical protein
MQRDFALISIASRLHSTRHALGRISGAIAEQLVRAGALSRQHDSQVSYWWASLLHLLCAMWVMVRVERLGVP